MEREVMWSAWEGPGLEHLRLAVSDEGIVANGLVIGVEGGRAFRVGYEVRCDERWRVREVRLGPPDLGPPVVDLLADGGGRWTTRGGDPVPELEGCVDVDISATPFTNTLPIRRLGLEYGGTAELDVAYVEVPGLLTRPDAQRYVRLGERIEGGLYRFETPPGEALPSGFAAELLVNVDGLVIDYPGLFRRVWSG